MWQKSEEIAQVDDKQQITAVFACTLSGDFLPMQLIFTEILIKDIFQK